jgi:hypothetical protein
MEQNNMPHLGGLINRKIYEKRHTRLSVGKLLGKHQMTVKGYTQEASVQARILWDLSKALNYDFFEHLSNALDLNKKKRSFYVGSVNQKPADTTSGEQSGRS